MAPPDRPAPATAARVPLPVGPVPRRTAPPGRSRFRGPRWCGRRPAARTVGHARGVDQQVAGQQVVGRWWRRAGTGEGAGVPEWPSRRQRRSRGSVRVWQSRTAAENMRCAGCPLSLPPYGGQTVVMTSRPAPAPPPESGPPGAVTETSGEGSGEDRIAGGGAVGERAAGEGAVSAWAAGERITPDGVTVTPDLGTPAPPSADRATADLLDRFLAGLRPRLPLLRALWAHGSLAGGDYQQGRSDLDLIAVVDRPCTPDEERQLGALHETLDRTDPSPRSCTVVTWRPIRRPTPPAAT